LKLEDKHIVYFLGIGGIGMSALARWFMHLGKKVCGYDKTPTPLTRKLEEEGAGIHYDDDVAAIPKIVLESSENTLIVLTPAMPSTHKEFNYLKDHGFPILKRSEVLGLITKDLYSVAVAGTHGKTTTSSMIAHILKTAGKSSLSLMGGILQGYESNLIIEGEPSTETIAVLEADEYDRSFLRLSPDISVVTSADADHLDIYGAYDEMKLTFKQFIHRTKPAGHLFINESLSSWLINENAEVATHSYSLKKGMNKASNVHVSGSNFKFDYEGELKTIKDVTLTIPGFHNVENAVAAIAVALQLGINTDSIKQALGSFKGVKRRFEYHIKSDNQIYIDDYAHHPTEISAFLQSVRTMYPGKKLTAIFQPHLFSRTRDFVDGFAESLDLADELIMMPIYPARELPIEGITSKIILDKMQNQNKKLVDDKELLDVVKSIDTEVLLTIGAGDIDRFVQPIKKLLEQRR
jgi:UDP-N-acetylmuramate--alanine ligase